jgi:hypothetical protein
MLQMWVLQNHSNKINVYFVTLKQVFHIELFLMQFVSNLYFQRKFQQNINAMFTFKACKHNTNMK